MGFGFIDLNDRWVIQPDYTKVKSFQGGVAVVGVKGRGCGLIDRTNHFVLPPQDPKFGILTMTRCGTRAIFLVGEKWGVCDVQGNVIVPAIYELICYTFGNERLLGCKLNSRYGFLDFDGNIVVDFKLKHADSFSSGCASVSYPDHPGESFIIDHQGEVIFYDPHVWVRIRVSQNLFVADAILPGDKHVTRCIMNLKGDVLFKSSDGILANFHQNNHVIVTDVKSDKIGVVDFAKNWIVPPEYDSVERSPQTSMFIVIRNKYTPEEEMMLLNPKGKPMFKRWYRELRWATRYSSGADLGFLLAIDKDGLHGALDYREKIVLKFKKREICRFPFYFQEGLLPCKVD